MGTGYNLGQMYYMNGNMQFNNFAYNPLMSSTASAAVSGNYNLTMPQFSYSQPNYSFIGTSTYNPSPATYSNYGGYGQYGYYGGASSSSSSSSSKETYEEKNKREYEETKKQIEDARAKAKEKQKAARQSVIFEGLTKDEEKILLEAHSKTYEPDMKLGATLASAVGVGAIMKNGGMVSHGYNTVKSLGKSCATTKMFRGNEELWKNSSNLMQEAYYQMHKAERRHHKGLGMIKKCYSDETYSKMKKMMNNAIHNAATNNDIEQLAEVTEKFKQVNVNDGWLSRYVNKIRGKSNKTPEEMLKAMKKGKDAQLTETITTGAKALVNNADMTWGKAFNQAKGGKMAWLSLLISATSEIGNITKAFKSDKKKGWKQLGQSGVKIVANWGGYIAGETVGIMAGAKIGAMIGSVAPGIGTAIGAVTGMICGTIVSVIAGNLAKKAVGYNVANAEKTKELIATDTGSTEVLQTLMQQAQNGDIKDEKVLKILEKFQAAEQHQQQQQQQQEIAVA